MRRYLRSLLLGLSLGSFATVALGQEEELPISIDDSTVGYIDNAIIGTQLRLRFDAYYGGPNLNRAEYIYAAPAGIGPGLPIAPEIDVDYQELATYFEYGLFESMSVFIEAGGHFINPVVNDNSSGIGDMKAGFKLALIQYENVTSTFQLKAYFPTADSDRGLGTGHHSLEPGVLTFVRLTERLKMELEFKDWFELDGTDNFAGNVLQYGAGFSYDLLRVSGDSAFQISPVVEFVGWTVIDGRKTVPPMIVDADGDTIVNAKFGTRTRLSANSNLYIGYGTALTSEVWYDEILRVEYRYTF